MTVKGGVTSEYIREFSFVFIVVDVESKEVDSRRVETIILPVFGGG